LIRVVKFNDLIQFMFIKMSKYLDPVFPSPFDFQYEVDLSRDINEKPWRVDLETHLQIIQKKLENFSKQVDDSILRQNITCEEFRRSLHESHTRQLELFWNEMLVTQHEQGKLLNQAMLTLQNYQRSQDLFSTIMFKMTNTITDLQNQVNTLTRESTRIKKLLHDQDHDQDDLFLYDDHTHVTFGSTVNN